MTALARSTRLFGALVAALLATALLAQDAGAVRLKDLGHFDGVRPNQLIGYGLVVGLDGTGDTQRSLFTNQSIEAMLSRVGVRIDAEKLAVRNVAAVMVTAELPAFAQPGTGIEVTVSSIGDARSIAGGTLLMTPLAGANNVVYAVAQGRIAIDNAGGGGRGLGARGGSVNVGRIALGGRIERTIAVQLANDGSLLFRLARPDFTTASRLATVVNDIALTNWGAEIASIVDAGTVEMKLPAAFEERAAAFIAEVEQLDIAADSVARVVLNARTGTIVLGGNVRLSPAAIAHRGVTIQIGGPRAPVTPANAAAAPPPTVRALPEATTLSEVVGGLNALGFSATELAEILQAMVQAGALHATVEVQ